MDWWGDMGYMLVYKIFEKMYLILEWTSKHMGKLTFSTAFFEITWSETANTYLI